MSIAGRGEDAAATGDLDIRNDVEIIGAGARQTILDGGGIDRVLHVNWRSVTRASAEVSDLTVRNGNPAVEPGRASPGGGIFNESGHLTVNNVAVSGNVSGGDAGGGIRSDGGGTLKVSNSTFDNNQAGAGGGGISSTTATITNSTISGNRADSGGGISASGTTTITNATISANRANVVGGGGGIQAFETGGRVTLKNTVVENNHLPAGANCAGVSGGGVGSRDGNIEAPGENGSSTSTCGLGGPNDSTVSHLFLGTLRNNGGPTDTHAPKPGFESTMIDRAVNASCPSTDQRGVARPQDGNADGAAICDRGAFELGDEAPSAEDDSYSTDEDQSVSGLVLLNDSDLNDDSLTVASPRPASGPSNGTLTLDQDGSFTYTPKPNFSGTDSFTYKATDGANESNTATVTITVNPQNDAPSAKSDTYSVAEDGTLTRTAPGVLANDSDVENESLTAAKVSDPSHGSLTLNSNGSFTYKPETGYTGTDSFTYKVNDGAADSSTATVSIEVKDETAPKAPSITSPADRSYDTDGTLTLSGTAEANTTVELFDGTTSKGTATANTSGQWTKTLTSVSDGSHSYTAKTKDAAGNTSSASAAVKVTVDKGAPTVASTTPATAATKVRRASNVTAAFSEEMDKSTLTSSTVKLTNVKTGAAVAATVTLSADGKTVTLDPTVSKLAKKTQHKVSIKGAKDKAGNALPDKEWTFATGKK